MKKVILILIFLGGILQASYAQTLKSNKKVTLKSEKFQLQKMPKLNAGLYERKTGDYAVPLGGSGWYPGEELSPEIINDFKNYNPPIPEALMPDDKQYPNEGIMNLPASNANDVIRVLDKDRILTHW